MILGAAGTWMLVGCIYIPTFNKRVTGRDVSRQVGQADSTRAVRVGRATRADVVRVLGEPTNVSTDGRHIAYSWTVLNGLWVFPLCFRATPQHETRALVLTFDANDTLVSYETTRNGQSLSTAGQPNHPRLPRDFYRPRYSPQTQATSQPVDAP